MGLFMGLFGFLARQKLTKKESFYVTEHGSCCLLLPQSVFVCILVWLLSFKGLVWTLKIQTITQTHSNNRLLTPYSLFFLSFPVLKGDFLGARGRLPACPPPAALQPDLGLLHPRPALLHPGQSSAGSEGVAARISTTRSILSRNWQWDDESEGEIMDLNLH